MSNEIFEPEYDVYHQFGAYTLKDFENMRTGDIRIMHYNCHNTGSFIWIHDRVDRNRAIGKYCNIESNINDAYEIEIYEYSGFMCVGSGAEPVCKQMPSLSCFQYGFDSS